MKKKPDSSAGECRPTCFAAVWFMLRISTMPCIFFLSPLQTFILLETDQERRFEAIESSLHWSTSEVDCTFTPPQTNLTSQSSIEQGCCECTLNVRQFLGSVCMKHLLLHIQYIKRDNSCMLKHEMSWSSLVIDELQLKLVWVCSLPVELGLNWNSKCACSSLLFDSFLFCVWCNLTYLNGLIHIPLKTPYCSCTFGG